MKPRRIAAVIVSAMVLVTTPLVACSTVPADEPIVLTLATDDDQSTPAAEQIEHLAETVADLSDGAMVIDPVWESTNGAEHEWDQIAARQVIDGTADLGLIPARAWDLLGVTSLQALQAPFLIASDEVSAAVVASDLREQLLSGLPDAGVVGIDLFPEGLRHPFGLDAVLGGVSDYEGRSIRTPASALSTEIFAALGATADDGHLDPAVHAGAESSFLLASAPYATGNVTFFPKINALVINPDVYESLSAAQREVLASAAASTREWVADALPSDADAAAELCATGVVIGAATDAQLDELVAAVQPVYASLEQDSLTGELIASIRELAAGVVAADPITSCDSVATDVLAGADANALNGVYEVTITEDDLIAGNITDPGMIADLAGVTFEWTLDDGRWSFTQSTGYSESGQFTLSDTTFTYYYGGGASQFTSALYAPQPDGSIVFSAVSASDPELTALESVVFSSHPWVRIGETAP